MRKLICEFFCKVNKALCVEDRYTRKTLENLMHDVPTRKRGQNYNLFCWGKRSVNPFWYFGRNARVLKAGKMHDKKMPLKDTKSNWLAWDCKIEIAKSKILDVRTCAEAPSSCWTKTNPPFRSLIDCNKVIWMHWQSFQFFKWIAQELLSLFSVLFSFCCCCYGCYCCFEQI